MIKIIVLLVILLIIILLLLTKVGAEIEYAEPGLSVKVLIGPAGVTVYPREKKKEKKSQPKEEKEKKKKGGTWEKLKPYLDLLLDLAGAVKERLEITKLDLDILLALSDPSKTAMAYGGVNAAIGILWPVLEEQFTIKNRDIRIQPDFETDKTRITVDAVLRIRIIQLLQIAVKYAPVFIKRYRKQKENGKVKSNGKQSSNS